MSGIVGGQFADHRHRQAIEDAAVLDTLQAEADITRLDLAAQRLSKVHWRVRDTNVQRRAGQLQRQQLVIGVVVTDVALDDHPRVIAHRQRQVQPCQGFADRTAGERFAVAQQHDVVGQSRDFILGMADVQHRDVEFVVQALQIRQDFTFALSVQRGQRFIHQQQFGAGEQRARNADPLALTAGEIVRVSVQQLPDPQQFGGMRHVHPALLFGNSSETELQIRLHRKMRKQTRFLKHITHSALVRWHKNSVVAVLPDVTIDLNVCAFGTFEPGDTAQAGGLAGAGMAVERRHPTTGQLQVHVQGEWGIIHSKAHMDHRSAPACFGFTAGIECQQHNERKHQHRTGQPMGLGIFHGFDVIVDLHRHHAGFVGNVAADHQHHAELTHGVCEAEDGSGDKTRAGEWQDHAEKRIPRIGAQGCRHFQRPSADGGKGILQWLDHEGHRVDHRTDHQPGKAEGQRAEAQRLRELTDEPVRAQCKQQIKADHGRWQHQGQGDNGPDRAAQPRPRAREPQGNRCADDQQDDRRQGGQFKGQPDRGKIGTR